MGDRIPYDPEYDMDEEMTREERWQRLTDVEKLHALAWVMDQKKTDEGEDDTRKGERIFHAVLAWFFGWLVFRIWTGSWDDIAFAAFYLTFLFWVTWRAVR